MESNHIHIFLEKILATARCPKCNEKVKLHNIFVQASTERTCVFKIHCDNCENDSLAQAVINIEPVSEIQEAPKIFTPEIVSEDEVNKIHAVLESDEKINISAYFDKL